MKKYLVTGGCGFIGSNFIKYVLNKYSDVSIVNLDALTYAGNLENLAEFEKDSRYAFTKGDIRDKNVVQNLFNQHDFDCVINFAAESHVDRSLLEPDLFCQTNVNGTLNLLNIAKEAWSKCGYDNKRFLQVSTDEVYGTLGKTGYFAETTPLSPRSPYSSSKASADMFARAYFHTYQMPILITRCSNNYGPYQFPEKLIPLVFNNVCNLKSVPVYGDGLQIRDWLYVTDHCSAIDTVINNGKIGEVYNIGGNNEKTNIEIVKAIISFVHNNINPKADENLITHVTDRLGHDRRYAIDASKIKNELGWTPQTEFCNGIEQTLSWYKNNSEWLKKVTSGEYKNYYDKMYLGR